MQFVLAELDEEIALGDGDYDKAADEAALEQEKQDAATALQSLNEQLQAEFDQKTQGEQQRAQMDTDATTAQINADQTTYLEATNAGTNDLRTQTAQKKDADDAGLMSDIQAEQREQDQRQKDMEGMIADQEHTGVEAVHKFEMEKSTLYHDLNVNQTNADTAALHKATAQRDQLIQDTHNVETETANTQAQLNDELQYLQQQGEAERATPARRPSA
jgi:hypothetical protein